MKRQLNKISIKLKLFIIQCILRFIKKDANYNSLYNNLKTKYKENPPYGYSNYDNWERAVERSKLLLNLIPDAKEKKLKILEIGCGDGMVGKILTDYGHSVFLIDLEDWREIRAKNIPYSKDISNLINANEKFDIIYSFNALEHVSDLKMLLNNIVKLSTVSTKIYVEFGPLYCSPWGLHAHHTINIPYPQYLFSKEFLKSELQAHGINDLGVNRETLQYVNELRYHEYMEMFKNSKLEIINQKIFRPNSHLNTIIKYPRAFVNKQLTIDDLTIQSVLILMQIK